MGTKPCYKTAWCRIASDAKVPLCFIRGAALGYWGYTACPHSEFGRERKEDFWFCRTTLCATVLWKKQKGYLVPIGLTQSPIVFRASCVPSKRAGELIGGSLFTSQRLPKFNLSLVFDYVREFTSQIAKSQPSPKLAQWCAAAFHQKRYWIGRLGGYLEKHVLPSLGETRPRMFCFTPEFGVLRCALSQFHVLIERRFEIVSGTLPLWEILATVH